MSTIDIGINEELAWTRQTPTTTPPRAPQAVGPVVSDFYVGCVKIDALPARQAAEGSARPALLEAGT